MPHRKASSPSANVHPDEVNSHLRQLQMTKQGNSYVQSDGEGDELFDLRTALDAIDKTQHYADLLHFNSFMREDPNISLREQVSKFKSALSEFPSQRLEMNVATEEGDFMHLPRSMKAEERCNEEQAPILLGSNQEIDYEGWEDYVSVQNSPPKRCRQMQGLEKIVTTKEQRDEDTEVPIAVQEQVNDIDESLERITECWEQQRVP